MMRTRGGLRTTSAPTARPAAVLTAVLAALTALLTSAPTAAAKDDSDGVLFKIADERITESSGLVASSRHADVYWTHNDSSDEPRLYAVGKDGATKATITLQGVDARDWEAISIGKDDAGNPAIFVGDIGDNLHGTWPEVWIYRFPEPTGLVDATIKATKFRVTYEDGPRDAEAMMIDPRNNKVYIVSKESDGGIYEQPAALKTTGLNTFHRISDAGSTITDGSFAPDGSRFVLRGYFSATVFSAPGKEVGTVGVPLQRQGESVAWSTDGKALLFGTEGKGSQVRRVFLDGDTRPDVVRTASARQDGDAEPGTGGQSADGADNVDDSNGVGDTAKTYGPGFLAVVGLVLLFTAYRKLGRSRRKH